jgi:Flp pilus assembly protein TadG
VSHLSRKIRQSLRSSVPSVRSFARDARGNIMILFAFSLVPITMMVSVGFNYSNAVAHRSQLQSIVDAAALAGAQAYANSRSTATASNVVTTYMNGASASLTGGSLQFTATPSTTTTNGLTSAYLMNVSATETVASNGISLTKGFSNTTIGARATAQINASYTATFQLNNFYSSACDGNTVYWYVVPTDGSIPAQSAMTQVWANTSHNNPTSVTMQVTFGQKIGFALKNVTGQQCGYGPTQYGSVQGQTNWFYSQLSPPSKNALPTVTQNCALMTVLDPSQSQLPPATPGNVGYCSATLPNNATLDCGQTAGHTVLYLWNDMGGPADDKDYNDADFTVSCSVTSSGVSAGTGPVLSH